MGDIVGAFAMSHVLGAPGGQEEQAEAVFAGMVEIGRRLRQSAPDILVLISSDHLNNFRLAEPVPFGIGVAERFTPYGDMGLSTAPFAGHPDFAAGFAAHAAQHGFPVAPLDQVKPDHGMMIPLGIVDRGHRIPAVPFYVNTVFDPAPEPARCWELGALLRDYIMTVRPEGERIALLAGGGLSHWLGNPQEGRVNIAWDHAFIQTLIGGAGRSLASLDNDSILRDAGNGGLEVNAWITLAGALPDARGECLFYEAIPAWASGMAGLELKVGTPA